jgi:adenine/guanine phosphoribosyltransferase-like PRPP-binding protein
MKMKLSLMAKLILAYIICSTMQEEFEDTKGVIRIRKSKKICFCVFSDTYNTKSHL